MFLTGAKLTEKIAQLANGTCVRFAVAFWGTGAETLIERLAERDAQLICNLKMGGTNPFVVEKFPRDRIRQHDTLHAKVYIGDTAAVVGSANASANGLGLEGREQGAWEEAGFLVATMESVATILSWFDRTWQASRSISNDDIEAAKAAWRARRAGRPTIQSFADFDLQEGDLPLLDWIENAGWKANPDLRDGISPQAFDALEERIGGGVDIEGPADRAVLQRSRWVLVWKMTSSGSVDRRSYPYWVKTGPILENAFRYEGDRELQAVALQAEIAEEDPFLVRDPRFLALFRHVIQETQYDELRVEAGREGWFTPERVQLMQAFWHNLQRRYRSGPA